MKSRLFSVLPAAMIAGAFAATGVAAAIRSAPDAGARAATPPAQAIQLAQTQMKTAPKKKAGGAAERGKTAVITPACPPGHFWHAAQKMCLPGPAVTPIPIPGTR